MEVLGIHLTQDCVIVGVCVCGGGHFSAGNLVSCLGELFSPAV